MLFKLKMLKTNFLKKIITFFCLMALVIINFSGCGIQEDEWVKRLGNDEVTFSEFLLLVSLKYGQLEVEANKNSNVYDDVTFEDIKETTINGVYAFEYLKDTVDEDIKRILAYRLVAKQLKISISDQERKALQKDAYSHYKSFNESFKACNLGISLKACENFIFWRALEYKVGEAIVKKGQVGEVKPDDIKNFINDKNSFAKYEILRVPKSLKDLRITDPDEKESNDKTQEEKEEDKKDKEKKKKEEDLQKIKNHFGVQTGDELAQKLLKKANDEKKLLLDVRKDVETEFKGLQNLDVSEKIEYMDEQKNEYQEYKTQNELELQKKIQKTLKTMQINGAAKTVEDSNYIYVLKLKEVDDDTIQKEESKITKILQEKNKKKYIDEVQKKYKDKIETNDDLFNVSIIEKQIKKVYKNKVKINSFPTV